MSSLKMETPDCNCGDNCCQPAKQKLWKKIFFFIVVLAALAIVTIKLSSNNQNNIRLTNDSNSISVKQAGGIDTTASKTCSKACDPSKSSTCCPQAKK